MRKYLLYYYIKNFTVRRYTYFYSTSIEEAWHKAEQLFGKGNLETMCEETNLK